MTTDKQAQREALIFAILHGSAPAEFAARHATLNTARLARQIVGLADTVLALMDEPSDTVTDA